MIKSFSLCADDFAITPGVSRSILELVRQGRLTATSVMTNTPHLGSFAKELSGFKDKIDIGLHLNLTLGEPLGAMPVLAPSGAFLPLRQLSMKMLRSELERGEIRSEVHRQLDAFEIAFGMQPDFIDGHQHVHALPGLRDVLFAIMVSRYPSTTPSFRHPGDSPLSILRRGIALRKALGLTVLTIGLAASAKRWGIATNHGFSGFSDFLSSRDYGADFGRYLLSPGARHLVMCHPGEIDDELVTLDPVVATRPLEAAFLASDRFIETCAAAGMSLARFGGRAG